MSSDTITLELDKYESGVVFHSLKDKRNQMLKEGKDTEYVRNQIFIKGTRKVFLSDVSKMRKARQLLQFIFLLCGNFRRYQKPCRPHV